MRIEVCTEIDDIFENIIDTFSPEIETLVVISPKLPQMMKDSLRFGLYAGFMPDIEDAKICKSHTECLESGTAAKILFRSV
ncbi:MAG: hypothetical protein OXC30_00095 [Alphaproteobacteria bacterium]|nr:hypothetical protein [Alphaproteobacteria bacterium]